MQRNEGLIIGLVGVSGSGKSTLGDKIGTYYDWEVVDVGKFFREAMSSLGKQIQEGEEVPLELDREIDGKTIELLSRKEIVIVGRTVSWLARKQQGIGKLGKDRYFGVGVNAPVKVLAKRAQPEWNRKKKLPEDTKLPTLKHVVQALTLRNSLDMTRYKKLYGVESVSELYGVPPNNIRVDSSMMDIDQELEYVLSQVAIFQSRKV